MHMVPEEFLDLKPVASKRPRNAYIEPTDRCNTRCLHCAHYHREFGMDMPEAVTRKAVDALVDGAEVIVAQGLGEPLISKSFYAILEACERKGVRVALVTNAIMLRDEALVRRLVRAPVYMSISVDGARAETYNFVRPTLDWGRFLDALALMRKCRKEAGKECRSTLSFTCVAMKDTFGDLPELVRMAHEYGVRAVSVQALSGDNGVEKLKGQSPFGDPDMVATASLEGMAAAREYGIDLKLPPAFIALACERAPAGLTAPARAVLGELARNRAAGAGPDDPGPRGGISPCRQPWDWTFITANGGVRACCMGGPLLGDLGAGDWGGIWNGPRYQAFRRLIHGWNPPAVCRECILPDGINGGDAERGERYFGRFRAERIDLDGKGVEFGGGFARMDEGGGRPSWRLKGGLGTLALPVRSGARFLGLTIAGQGRDDLAPGTCAINGGIREPFDLSVDSIHFPVGHGRTDRLQARFEMEGLGTSHLVIREASILL